MLRTFCLPLALLTSSLALPALAQQTDATDPAPAAATPDISRVQAALRGATPDAIAETPVPGLYELTFGSQVLYLSADGRYVIQGEVTDLDTARNLTEARLNGLRADTLAQVSPENMIVFSPEGEARHHVTVFTDIDCGYCRKLHQEIDNYTDLGIEVRYMAFPRAGLESESFNKAVSAWCADDQKEALTQAKLGQAIEPKTCDNPVADQYSLGQRLGVRGTPSIFLEDGQMVPGYVPAERLAQMLDQPRQAD